MVDQTFVKFSVWLHWKWSLTLVPKWPWVTDISLKDLQGSWFPMQKMTPGKRTLSGSHPSLSTNCNCFAKRFPRTKDPVSKSALSFHPSILLFHFVYMYHRVIKAGKLVMRHRSLLEVDLSQFSYTLDFSFRNCNLKAVTFSAVRQHISVYSPYIDQQNVWRIILLLRFVTVHFACFCSPVFISGLQFVKFFMTSTDS